MSAMERKTVKKGSIALYLALLLIAIIAMIALRNFDKIVSTPDKPQRDSMVVAIEYSPLSLYTYSDTLGGFSYDLLRMVAQKAGINLKYQPMVTLTSSLNKLKSGEYRMVCAEFPVIKENKDDYLFTTPINVDRQVLVQRIQPDSTIAVKSLLDLAHDTVWVVDGSSIASRLLNLSHEIGDTIYINADKEYGTEQLFLRVATGEIKQAVMNERVAKKMATLYPNVDISTSISFTQFQSWILQREDSTFCNSINSWLEAVKLTPEYKSLYDRYFSN